jgi:N-acetylglucosamine repressor
MGMVKSRPDLLRKINDRQILNLLRQKSPLSRTEIARDLNLAMPTVSRIVDSFLEQGWVQSIGTGDSTGGRPPTLIQLNPNSTGAMGVEIGRGYIRIVYTDLLASVLINDERPIEQVGGPVGLLEYIRWFILHNKLTKDQILGVGIAAPGPLDADAGRLLVTDNRSDEWAKYPICSLVSDSLQLPCYLSNDANAAALAESWFGKGEDFESALFVLVDIGLGAGIVIERSIWDGKNHFAGDFAHMIVDVNGTKEMCFCDRPGCVNSYASLRSIERMVSIQRGEPSSWRDILKRASKGETLESDVVTTAARMLATAVVNMTDVIDPGIVIMGGRTCLYSDAFFFEQVKQQFESMIGNQKRTITLTSFGVDAVSVGAASLVLQSVYDHMYAVTEH